MNEARLFLSFPRRSAAERIHSGLRGGSSSVEEAIPSLLILLRAVDAEYPSLSSVDLDAVEIVGLATLCFLRFGNSVRGSGRRAWLCGTIINGPLVVSSMRLAFLFRFEVEGLSMSFSFVRSSDLWTRVALESTELEVPERRGATKAFRSKNDWPGCSS